MADERNTTPSHWLKVKERNGPATTTIGVAWARDGGAFAIRLNPACVLDWRDDLVITLFPNEGPPAKGKRKPTESPLLVMTAEGSHGHEFVEVLSSAHASLQRCELCELQKWIPIHGPYAGKLAKKVGPCVVAAEIDKAAAEVAAEEEKPA